MVTSHEIEKRETILYLDCGKKKVRINGYLKNGGKKEIAKTYCVLLLFQGIIISEKISLIPVNTESFTKMGTVTKEFPVASVLKERKA